MSRTSPQSMPYWQHDVGFYDDVKVVDLNDRYGPLGESILSRIYDIITKTEGYYTLFNEQLILSIYRSVGSKWIKNRAVVAEVIHYCGACGLFDVKLLTQNVITSCGIQRRWLYAKQKSRAKGYSTAKYWLLENEHNMPLDYNNEELMRNKADKCSNKADKCNMKTPYKEKESKVNKSSGGSSDYGLHGLVVLTETEYGRLREEIGEQALKDYINRLDSWLTTKPLTGSHANAILKWYNQDKPSESKPSVSAETLNALFADVTEENI